MFCDRCGKPITGRETFCAGCGRQLNPAAPPLSGGGRVANHIRLLAIFWLAYSALRLVGGWVFSNFLGYWWSGYWGFRFPFLPRMLHGVGMALMAVGIAGLIAGWGLFERQPWARPLAIVLGFIVLFHFGLGTVLGIYTLWVLMPAESEQEYQRIARVV